MENNNEPQFWQKSVKIISHCLFCHSPYTHLQANLLDERDDGRLIYVRCQKCQTAVLASVTPGAMGFISLYMVTDCTPEDVIKFKEMKSLNGDEVLAFRESLQNGEDVIESLNRS